MLFHTIATPDASSIASSDSGSSRSRASSTSSAESLSSATKEAISTASATVGVMSTHPGILATILALALPHDDAEPWEGQRSPRYTRRPVILSEAQERNPPTLPPLTPTRIYRKALVHTGRTFTARPRRAPALLPRPIDPKSLSTAAIPATVYTSPIALPLPKGPAPPVLYRRSCALDPANRPLVPWQTSPVKLENNIWFLFSRVVSMVHTEK
ncbi:hypothetical protein FB451DRAFT_1173555 [Mycena latifolia]|nr:hypothetical protein FB451DRAFT_1173555 [Mycena latifolia]